MAALANLSRNMGIYEGWMQLRRAHDLKWTSFNPEVQAAVFREVFYSQDGGFTAMLDWLREVRKRLSAGYMAYVDFLVLTGLRPDEGAHSINILRKQGYEGYLNRDRMMLEHFQFPMTFIRRTKKAYVLVVTDQLLSAVQTIKDNNIELPETYYQFWNQLKSNFTKNGGTVQLPMNQCRKIYGTWLKMNGIDTEFINLLQGRVASEGSKSPEAVFAKHYFRPDFDKTCERVRGLTVKLYAQLYAEIR